MGKILEVTGLKKYFDTKGGLLHAVDGVSFFIEKGKTLGVVGESGCGKSTLGRVILHLLDATDGSIAFEGQDITHPSGRELLSLRQNMQMIFQDPYSSLDPRMSISQLIGEPLCVHRTVESKADMRKRVEEIMDTVGLSRELADSYPHELDGGRRQRIGIGRALALNPKFIVCDEPVSALDVSIQAQILNLLMDLQRDRGLTYIFITHNLSVVKHISNDIAVMYLGMMVEKASSDELFMHQYHPYTKALISAIPSINIDDRPKRILMNGELTSPIEPPDACRFAPRCQYATKECFEKTPDLQEITPGHFTACFKARDFLTK